MGNAWLLWYTIQPHHLHCQAAWIGHHALQGQVVNLREGHSAQSRRGQSHSVSLLSEQSSIWGECWKIGLSLPTSTFTPAVSGRGQGHVQCRGTQCIARVGLPCQSVQGTKVRVYLRRGIKFPLTAELSVLEFCVVMSVLQGKYMGNWVRAAIFCLQVHHWLADCECTDFGQWLLWSGVIIRWSKPQWQQHHKAFTADTSTVLRALQQIILGSPT